jgi:hypothetical protein
MNIFDISLVISPYSLDIPTLERWRFFFGTRTKDQRGAADSVARK